MTKYVKIGFEIFDTTKQQKEILEEYPNANDFKITFEDGYVFVSANIPSKLCKRSFKVLNVIRCKTYTCSDNIDDLISAIIIDYPVSGKRIFVKKYLRRFTQEELEDKLNKGYKIYGYSWVNDSLLPAAELKLTGWKIL